MPAALTTAMRRNGENVFIVRSSTGGLDEQVHLHSAVTSGWVMAIENK